MLYSSHYYAWRWDSTILDDQTDTASIPLKAPWHNLYMTNWYGMCRLLATQSDCHLPRCWCWGLSTECLLVVTSSTEIRRRLHLDLWISISVFTEHEGGYNCIWWTSQRFKRLCQFSYPNFWQIDHSPRYTPLCLGWDWWSTAAGLSSGSNSAHEATHEVMFGEQTQVINTHLHMGWSISLNNTCM